MNRPALRDLWRRRPRVGARGSIAIHGVIVLLCAVALQGGYAPALASLVLTLNLLALGIIALAAWIGELPEDRKPFGPFTEAAEFLGFLDERTPQGRFIRQLRDLGMLE